MNGRITRGRWAMCAGALSALLAAGCAGSEAAGALVGAVEGTDAVVAANREGDTLTFYLCGGPTTYDTLTRWFSGPADGSAFTLENEGFTIEGDLDAAEGTLTDPDGATHPWRAHPLTPDTLEGLYAVTDSGCRTGAVITQLSSDDEPALQGAWCDAAGQVAQVTPVLPIERTQKGVAVRVATPTGDRQLYVQPLTPLPAAR